MGKWPWCCLSTNQDCSNVVPASAKFQKCWSHLCAYPCGPEGQIIITLHIYKPRWFQFTWFKVNQPSGCWVLASARFHEILLCPWANPCGVIFKGPNVAHLQVKAVPVNLIWSASTQLLLSWASKISKGIYCLWGHPCDPKGPVALRLQMYRARQFQWDWFAVNWTRGCLSYGICKTLAVWTDGRQMDVPTVE